MNQKKFDKTLGSVSKLFRVLANPDRLRLISLLQKGEKGVGELHQLLEISQSSVSQHLRLLKLNGVVDSRQEGTHHYYFLRNSMILKVVSGALEFQTDDRIPEARQEPGE